MDEPGGEQREILLKSNEGHEGVIKDNYYTRKIQCIHS